MFMPGIADLIYGSDMNNLIFSEKMNQCIQKKYIFSYDQKHMLACYVRSLIFILKPLCLLDHDAEFQMCS